MDLSMRAMQKTKAWRARAPKDPHQVARATIAHQNDCHLQHRKGKCVIIVHVYCNEMFILISSDGKNRKKCTNDCKNEIRRGQSLTHQFLLFFVFFQSWTDVPNYRHSCFHRRCLRVRPCGPRCRPFICSKDELRGIFVVVVKSIDCIFLHSFHVVLPLVLVCPTFPVILVLTIEIIIPFHDLHRVRPVSHNPLAFSILGAYPRTSMPIPLLL